MTCISRMFNERLPCSFTESSTQGVKRGRGRGRRGRLSRGSHGNSFQGNGPLPSRSSSASKAGETGVILGGDGEEKGSKRKVICVLITGALHNYLLEFFL